ncbi:group II intron reverse transcriptase/maturase [Pedobacter sp. L105]|uniref:group II intron reverse transcriptase/maturase n=1 Tax=Pedobacter sp. L105 TaxID=1641871 RepID=UPI001C202538|nr:group II intron reverse transcriptase/maturase [Pedobacter sp. L105]
MTVNNKMYTAAIGADNNWNSIDWKSSILLVRKLQMRIARWAKQGNHRKVKALQWLLSHSFAAKCLAVKKITQNKGHRTAGIDGVILSSPEDKWKMVHSLKRRGYKSLPLRRVYIMKSNGKKRRPLGLPSMKDRAMQALHTMALLPVSEMSADWNSYGFRPERGTADAIEQLFIGLGTSRSSQWILEGDIKACFDQISHEWMLRHIPMDKKVLLQWLKAGYVESGKLFPTNQGTPQGGLASPTLANMVLDGIEDIIGQKFGSFKYDGDYERQRKNPVLFVRYADDFVVIGRTKEVLEQEIKSMIQSFLKERGLELSETKTKISHIYDGFDFLGQNIRKYQILNGKDKLLIKPSKKNIQTFLTSIRRIVKSARSMSQTELIRLLNPKIRGWAYYHRSIVASKIYSSVDKAIWEAIWRWSLRRHPSKGRRWVHARYFHRIGLRQHCFQSIIKENGKTVKDTLFHAVDVAIVRHIKIKQQAIPFDMFYDRYFQERTSQKWKGNKSGKLKVMALWKRQVGCCPICLEKITKESNWIVHWHKSKLEGGSDALDNLCLVHPKCCRRGSERNLVFAYRPG